MLKPFDTIDMPPNRVGVIQYVCESEDLPTYDIEIFEDNVSQGVHRMVAITDSSLISYDSYRRLVETSDALERGELETVDCTGMTDEEFLRALTGHK